MKSAELVTRKTFEVRYTSEIIVLRRVNEKEVQEINQSEQINQQSSKQRKTEQCRATNVCLRRAPPPLHRERMESCVL